MNKGTHFTIKIGDLIKKWEKETDNTVIMMRYGLRWDDEEKRFVYDLSENFVYMEYKSNKKEK